MSCTKGNEHPQHIHTQTSAYAVAERMQIFPGLLTSLIVLTKDELKRFDYHPVTTKDLSTHRSA